MKIIEMRIEESVLPKKDKDWKFALAANPATRRLDRQHPGGRRHGRLRLRLHDESLRRAA